jgi:hypothetical protein
LVAATIPLARNSAPAKKKRQSPTRAKTSKMLKVASQT